MSDAGVGERHGAVFRTTTPPYTLREHLCGLSGQIIFLVEEPNGNQLFLEESD